MNENEKEMMEKPLLSYQGMTFLMFYHSSRIEKSYGTVCSKW